MAQGEGGDIIRLNVHVRKTATATRAGAALSQIWDGAYASMGRGEISAPHSGKPMLDTALHPEENTEAREIRPQLKGGWRFIQIWIFCSLWGTYRCR